MNFTTDLPKGNPIVKYIVASAVKCAKYFPEAQREGICFRMHAVVLKDPSKSPYQPIAKQQTLNSGKGYILCHIRRVKIVNKDASQPNPPQPCEESAGDEDKQPNTDPCGKFPFSQPEPNPKSKPKPKPKPEPESNPKPIASSEPYQELLSASNRNPERELKLKPKVPREPSLPLTSTLVMQKHVVPLNSCSEDSKNAKQLLPRHNHVPISHHRVKMVEKRRTDALLDVITNYLSETRRENQRPVDYIRLYQIVSPSLFP